MRSHSHSSSIRDKKTSFGGWLIFVIGVIFTSIALLENWQREQREYQLKTKYQTSLLLRRIKDRLESYSDTLLQTRAYLLSHDRIEKNNFNEYLKNTQVFERLPGIQGIGVSLFVRKNDLQKYQVWPIGQREVYSAIIFLGPEDKRNIRAIGYDMYSEQTRRTAMNLARDTGEAHASEKVFLVQEDDSVKLPGFLVYFPLYKKNASLKTVEDRRANILGYVYAPFRAPVLFKEIFQESGDFEDIEVFLGDEIPKNILYDRFTDRNEGKIRASFDYAGHKYALILTPKKNDNRREHYFILAAGLIGTFLLLWIWFLSRKQTQIAELIAAENKRMLEQEKLHVVARDEFLSIASHELKTPLTSLKLQAQVINRALNRKDPSVLSEERIRSLVNQIDGQTTRLTRLVDDMLDISRIRTGKLRIEKENVDLAPIVLEVVEKLKPQFIEKTGSEVEVIVNKTGTGFWDRFRIEQVLMNLLTNALRYGNNRPVTVIVDSDGHNGIVHVIDRGIGISNDNIEKIFNRFERAGISSSEISGLGLGLFITKQIVGAHGGDIRVKSQQGEGSTFTLMLPLVEQKHTTDNRA